MRFVTENLPTLQECFYIKVSMDLEPCRVFQIVCMSFKALYLCESIMLTKTMTLDYEVVHVYLQSDMF